MPTSAELVVYLDSSAIVKLVADEQETAALRTFLGDRDRRASASLARVEVVRAVRQQGAHAIANARAVLEAFELIGLDDELLDRAADLEPPLRSLDAIYLAAALELGDELQIVVTYDVRMVRAAEALGLTVVAPA